MPFLGVQPTDTFAAVAKQTITGDGSTTYTLTHSVASANDLAVFVNNVRQEPTTAYSASGTSITFTEAIASTDSCYVVYIARTFQTLSPPDNSVNADQISYPLTNFSSTGIDDNADATAITIDSSEQVGIGTANPSDKLHVYGGSSGGTTAHSYTQLHVEHSSHSAIQLSSPANTESVIFFSDPDDNDIGGIGYYHAQDYLYLRSYGATRLRVDADGIKFGSDSAAANALDDYEEGTWTPTYTPSSGSFGSLTYQNQIGHYTKIGDVVNLHARIDTTSMSIGTASGYLLVGNLPFTCHGSAYQSAIVSYSWGFSSYYPTAGSTGTGMTALYLYAPDRTASTASIVPSNLGTSTTYLYVSCTYKTT